MSSNMSFIFITTFTFSLFFLSLASPPAPLSPPSYDPQHALRYNIDCGSPTNSTDSFNTTWLSDRFFTGGATSVVSEPLHFRLHPQEKTLRYFPLSSGKTNCYVIPHVVNNTRFYIRTFTVYDNYDGKSHSPSFDVSVEGTVVFSYRSPWPEKLARDGAYSDLFVFVKDEEIDVCFYSIATDPPVIGSIRVVEVDSGAYDSGSVGGKGFVMVNYGRLSCGSGQWGPGFSNDSDVFGRSWQAEGDYLADSVRSSVKKVTTNERIIGADKAPNYFPMKLYQSGVTIGGNVALEYVLEVDAKMDYLVWLHFAEIDSSVTKAGQRVFDVVINGNNVTRIDIVKSVGRFAAYSWHYTVKSLSSTLIIVKLVPVVGAPLLCGLENYALVPKDLATVPEQVAAMRALKESLRVPDRMGWNGDPCAPTTWDAWEGVTCHPNKDGSALVITQIDLGSQGLKGYISDQISLLTNLASLNLSSNSLGGTLPSGLGQKSLVRLDLSNNQFTGSIPYSLASSKLQLVLLNDNQLEGAVPEELYSVGVHGGVIDLSGNKGLCGVPSLPACPIFWDNGRLSTGGKIAIAMSSLFLLCLMLLAIYVYRVKRSNDYDFALPHDLMSLSAKRNRFQREKSLMHLEMESQHAKGLTPVFTTQRQSP